VRSLRYWLSWRPAGPIGWATLAAAVLVLVGLSFAVVAPLAAGAPRADSAPSTAASKGAPASIPPTTADPTDDLQPSGSTGTTRTSTLESQLISLINKGMDDAGCDKLHTDSHLRSSARSHSADMAKNGFVSRTGSDHSSPQERMKKAGYRKGMTEDVGSGYPDAQSAYDAWRGDSKQRDILTDCNARAVGVGVAAAPNGTLYWTADFGG
jgi:uncharacterized protein YkwD